MEKSVTHLRTSAGALIKKIIEINPDIEVNAMIELIRECTSIRQTEGDFTRVEVIDEEKALRLARESLKVSKHSL